MPKMKTKRAAAKRYRVTASGKVKVKKAFLRHILEKKSKGSKRDKRKAGYVHPSDLKLVWQTLPYAAKAK
ncbi:MAG: 50S ribosomal protein L35 [Bacteriovoracaceae bacterium]